MSQGLENPEPGRGFLGELPVGHQGGHRLARSKVLELAGRLGATPFQATRLSALASQGARIAGLADPLARIRISLEESGRGLRLAFGFATGGAVPMPPGSGAELFRAWPKPAEIEELRELVRARSRRNSPRNSMPRTPNCLSSSRVSSAPSRTERLNWSRPWSGPIPPTGPRALSWRR